MGSLDRTSKQPDVPDVPEEGKHDDPYDPGHLDVLDVLDDQRKSKYEQLLEVAKNRENIQDLESAGKETVRLAEGLQEPDRVEPSCTEVGTPDRPEVYRASREELHGGELAVAPVVIWLLGHYGVERVREWLTGKQPTGEADGGD